MLINNTEKIISKPGRSGRGR